MVTELVVYARKHRTSPLGRVWIPNIASNFWSMKGVYYVGNEAELWEKKARVEQAAQGELDSELDSLMSNRRSHGK